MRVEPDAQVRTGDAVRCGRHVRVLGVPKSTALPARVVMLAAPSAMKKLRPSPP